MKTRNGLLFALCVLTGSFGFAACSDDGGSGGDSSDLVVSESKVEMHVGESLTFNVQYKENTAITIESDDSSCVSTVAAQANTGAENNATVQIKAEKENCVAVIKVSADGKEKSVKATVLEGSVPFISITPSEINLSAGDQGKVTALFAKGVDPFANEQLNLVNNNPNCVEVADKTNATNAQGKVDIMVSAKNVTEECSAQITVSKPATVEGDVQSQTFTVNVAAGDPTAKASVLKFADDNNTSMSGDSDELMTVYARYYYEESSEGISGKSVGIQSDNNACVKSKDSSYTTDSDGKIAVELERKGVKCDAVITASVDGKQAQMNVTVTDANEIVIKSVVVNANSKYDKMGWTTFTVLDGDGVTCDVAMADLLEYANWDEATANPKNSAGEPPLVARFKAGDLKESSTTFKVDITQHKGILAFASASDESEVIVGAGCVPISKEDNNKVVTIELAPIPTNIKGNYIVYSNFDLTSAFEYNGKLAPVEEMKGGDWINWIADLFENPLNALWDFVWVNTLERLAALDTGNNTVNSILQTVVGNIGKELAGGYVKPLINGYLKDYKWYQVINEVSPDVEDLIRNMQFKGEINVDDVTGVQINTASETFKYLQYQWSSSDIKQTCISEDMKYGDPNKCRVSMSLTPKAGNEAKYETIAGTWNGTINDEDLPTGVDGLLNINSHSLTFKWASILYAAVFGEILPTALDYKDKPNITKGRYLSAFLDKLLFDSVTKYYVEKCVGKSKCAVEDGQTSEGSRIYPELTITDASKSCERFIESIVYLIYDVSKYSGVISVLADFACGDQALGQLDSWVDQSLSKLESGTQNQLTLKASNCALYDEGTTDYTKMGQPDENYYTANDVFKTDSKVETVRCEWNISLPESVSSKPIKGLFHAYRNTDDE